MNHKTSFCATLVAAILALGLLLALSCLASPGPLPSQQGLSLTLPAPSWLAGARTPGGGAPPAVGGSTTPATAGSPASATAASAGQRPSTAAPPAPAPHAAACRASAPATAADAAAAIAARDAPATPPVVILAPLMTLAAAPDAGALAAPPVPSSPPDPRSAGPDAASAPETPSDAAAPKDSSNTSSPVITAAGPRAAGPSLQPAAPSPAAAAAALPSPPPAVPGEPEDLAFPRNGVPPPPPDAEALARTYRATGRAVPIERGTESLFPFGHGRPVLRCAPLRACALELEPGEVVLATSLGDGERWLVQSAASGPGARTPLLVVKPTACDLATNLLVATDRRIYEIALDSPPCKGADAGEASYNPRLPYTGLVRFYYPDDLVRRWSDREEAARREADRQAAGRTPLAPAARLARLNFDYAWDRGKKLPWNPVQVFDDGEHTYLVLPPASRQADLPLLFAVEAGGALALLNYRLDGQTLVADRIVERAALLAGSPGARGSRRLDIANRAFGRRAGS